MRISLDIVVPTLNSGNTLEETLRSLEKLRRSGANVIVVDSHSVDDTVAIADRGSATVTTVDAGNMYKAINCGIKMGTSEWVAQVNSDDILYADGIEEAYHRYSKISDVIYGSIDFMDKGGRFLSTWNSPIEKILPELAREMMPIPQLGTIFKRSVFEDLGGFETQFRLSSDFDFFVRALMKGYRFARLKSPRVGSFRVHGCQLSQTCRTEMKSEIAAVRLRNGLEKRTIKSQLLLWFVRAQNLDTYLIRALRTKHLSANRVSSQPT